MKILLFYMGYIPGQRYGGPVTSMFHFVEMFGDCYDIRLICKDHDFLAKEKYSGISSGWNKVGKAEVLYLADENFNKKTFEKIIETEKPDIIYSSSIFLAQLTIPLLIIARQKKVPMLLAPRGELSSDRIRTKWWKKKPYLFILRMMGLLKGNKLQATSEAEYRDILTLLKVNEKNVFMVENIPCSLKQKTKIEKEKGKIKIVATSRIQQKNNQLYSIKLVNQMKSNVQFDIYGPKEDPGYWKLCEAEIKKAPSNVVYNYKGVLPLTEIANVYLGYDCLLHPTHSENYGHVIVEAFCHDCPVVISKGTTPWDDIETVGAGFACDLKNYGKFIERLDYIAQMDVDEYTKMVNCTREYSNKMQLDVIKEKYINMFANIIDN